MRWIPNANITEVVGLLEIIDDNNGEIDVDDLQRIVNIEVDELMPVIKAAKLLGFVELKGRKVKLTQKAKEFLEKDAEDRKEMLAEEIKNLDVFKRIENILLKRREITYDELLAMIAEEMPEKEAKEELKVIIEWGQYAELFDFDIKNNSIKILG